MCYNAAPVFAVWPWDAGGLRSHPEIECAPRRWGWRLSLRPPGRPVQATLWVALCFIWRTFGVSKASGSCPDVPVAQVLSIRCNPVHAQTWFNCFFFRWALLNWTLESFLFLHVDLVMCLWEWFSWWNKRGGTSGRQLAMGMKRFLRPCALTFMDRPPILLHLGQYFSLPTRCLYEANVPPQFLPCPGSQRAQSPQRRLLDLTGCCCSIWLRTFSPSPPVAQRHPESEQGNREQNSTSQTGGSNLFHFASSWGSLPSNSNSLWC